MSKHHYAIHLAHRGNKVFFLNPPAGKNELLDSGIDGLTILDYNGFLSGMRFLPKMIRRSLTRQKWEQIQKLTGVQFDVIWSFDNSVFYDFDALPESVMKISHIVDLNQNHMTPVASRSADICLGVTSKIVERASLYNHNSYFINHGYALKPAEKSNFSLASFDGLKVCYVGNLDIVYLDWLLIEDVVERYSNIAFYFAGSCKSDLRRKWFEDCENVFYVGALNQADLNTFYSQSDILIMAYLADDHRDQLANPHKILEYLGTGKPIVSTFTAEYSDKRDLLYMSHSNSDWLSVFEYVSSNMSECSSELLVSMRKEFAMQNTYDKQIDRIQELITNEVRK